MSLLEIRNLSVDFATSSGAFRAVDAVDVETVDGDQLGHLADVRRLDLLPQHRDHMALLPLGSDPSGVFRF